ncbi:hypothetical protein KXW98_005390 [Aspergillus fumigatus]|nr:hypothetical protein KXX66_007347 [Aspergillus fumigatus]KAH1360853.1 hypothetical protein KXX33_004936 [Aspergillus fumigatus]KAH1388241.1 hypothetical protein KXX50_002557 [Aspergillus fumigatus]KAH1540756.1 hypothetical protein KXX61_005577 [Aspergillus fumigatus]KAH1558877.1 hypothetical protein KXX37_005943 [Aspergillus fumigatus]
MGFVYSQLFVTPKYPTQEFPGRTVIVTGANVGLGLEAARHFCRLGAAKVILAVRNTAAGEIAEESIEKSTDRRGMCEAWELDLASYTSVQAFAAQASRQLSRIDILVANAGIATTQYTVAEGHERSLTVNVISTVLLAMLLLPKMRETALRFPSEIPHLSVVTSEVHAWTNLPEWKADDVFAALDNETTADHAIALCGLEASADSDCTGTRVEDGWFWGRSEHAPAWDSWATAILKTLLARSTEVGSRTILAAASAGPESHGAYMRDGKVDNGALSSFVRSEDGQKARKKVWKELVEILQRIQPDIVAPLF